MRAVAEWVVPICWVTFGVVWLVGAFSAKPAAARLSGWRRSWYWIAMAMLALVLLPTRRATGQMNIILWSVSLAIVVIADVATVVGLAIAIWSRVALGVYWSGNVVVKEAHVIIDHGPYRFVRHPIYSGVLLMLLGTALVSGRLVGLLLFVVAFACLIVKARLEERLLSEHFPVEYASYKARVKRTLVPWLLLSLPVVVAVAAAPPILSHAQSRPKFDAFEVATIKAAGLDAAPGRWIRMESANRFVAHNHAIRTLVAAAYDLAPEAIGGGPSWVDSDRWEILAKTPGDVRPTPDEQMSMLRQLLRDRFALSFHREAREFAIFALTVAPEGPKLKQTTISADARPQGPPLVAFVMAPTVVRLPARYLSMAEFASLLQRSPLDRPVADRTGLPGRYDFDLEFAPDESLWGGLLPRPENSDKPGLIRAMQEQLGLNLESARGLVDSIVIDHVERPTPD